MQLQTAECGLKARFQPIPHYQPSSEQPLKSTYEQGYQAQTPSSMSWTLFTQRSDQPKQDPPGAFYDHQVTTPEQAPPPMQGRPKK